MREADSATSFAPISPLHLHGPLLSCMAQGQRESTLRDFRGDSLSCIIATDVASRGLDIPEVKLRDDAVD